MSGDTGEKLVYMINQIARNVCHEPDPGGVIAKHVTTFWSPRMKTMFFDWIAAHGLAGLEPEAQAAHARLFGTGADAA
jgi:formate dehydrogenase subunit delta